MLNLLENTLKLQFDSYVTAVKFLAEKKSLKPGIFLIGSLGIHFNVALIEISIFFLKKMYLKMSSAKWRLFHLDLNDLM